MANQTLSVVGKDIIYICQSCQNREKEYSLPDRNHKYCQRCGCISIKATLVDSYNHIQSKTNVEDEADYE